MMLTRRNVLKNGIGLAGIIAAGRCPAYIRGLVAAHNVSWHGGILSNPYISDGLIAMWDTIWNAGYGVSVENPTTWIDCIAQRQMDFNTTLSWNNGEVILQHTTNSMSGPEVSIPGSVDTDSLTLEICGRIIKASSDIYNGSGAKNSKALICICNANSCLAWEYGNHDIGKYKYSWHSSVLPGTITHVITSSSAMMYGRGVIAPLKQYIQGTGNYANDGIVLTPNNSNAIIGIHGIRLYSRALTTAEVAYNYAIDKERFGL